MSVDQIPSRQSPGRPNDTKLVRYEDYIESKIDSTRRMVKAVDLASALVTLVAAVLAYLLTIAVIEHWIVPSGFNMVGRTALFTILVIGVGYFVYHRVWSLLVKAINPVYAARTIEHGSPTLKNTLINLLFFRERRAGISDAVYRTLEEQAAQRLTRVPVETAVDRSLLIRLGYVLIAVVALAGLYKVFSPKDPLISAERILFPWADIVPASRVTISALTPGSVTVSRGESVDVSAEVHGLGDNDAVVLRYTTADGQVVGKAIPMKLAGDGLRYACKVTDTADESDSVGLTRSLTYRLEAGDARSLDYSITVISAPSILVERVDYHYPLYTGYVDRSVEGLGDIRAIEGTRMTIHARANGVIRVADVDFDADGRPDLRMTTKEAGADASFELSLREDRQTPRHASYVLRFTNEEGRANRDPVKHSIGVDRDMDPEASVLLPKEKDINARLDETVAIDVEAIDPDFGLAGVRLRGEAAGQTVLDEQLLKAAHRGKFLGHYSFVANAHGLHAGDEVKYWLEAADVRTPKPNVVITERRTIRIVSPNPGQQPPPDRVARNDRQQPKPDANQNGGKQDQQNPGGQGQGEKNQGGAADQNNGANKQQGGESGGQGNKSQQPQQGEQQQGGGQGEKGGEQNNNNNDQQQSKGDSKSGGEGKSTNSQGGEQKGNEQKSGENGQSGSQSQSGESSNQKSKDGQQGKGEQTGAGASGGQQSKDAARPAGTRQPDQPGAGSARPDQGQKPEGEKGRGGEKEKGQPQSKSGDQQSPVSSEGDNDGEAFERIQKRLEKSGEIKKDEKSGSESEQKQGEKSEGEKGREGGGEKAQQQQSGQDKQAGDKSQDGKSGNGQSGEKPGEAEQKQQPGHQGKGDGKTGEKQGDSNQEQQSGRQEKGDRKSGDAKSQGDESGQKKQQQPGDGEKQQSPGGQENTSKGPAGAGEEKQPTGSPKNSEQAAKPTEKHEQSGSKEGTNKQEPPAGANGKKESDSSGDQGGDKTGGGEEGAGQKSPREGTGSDGQHQSADNGAGQSGEKGKGETSQSGGKDAKSDHETGSSDGKTPGKGSQQKDGTGNKQGGKAGGENATSRDGENAGGEKGDKAGSKEGEKNAAQSKAEQEGKEAGKQQQEKDGKGQGKPGGDGGGQQGGEKGQGKDGKGQGKPGGDGGGPGGAVNPQPNITGTAPEGDTANLEYARKRTDLVLDKLADQLNKNKVDDGMLKELGWTRDDLRRFVERWQQRKDAAERDDPKAEGAKRELDEALRSLGLRQDKLQQNAVQKDTMRDLKQGYRGPVPLEYQERLRAYNQGVSRAARDGE